MRGEELKTKDSALNPNHPVTAAMEEQWHKIVALMMFQAGETEIEIPVATIERFAREKEGCAVAIRPSDTGLRLSLVDAAEAARLAREEGGLPH
jgi:hypothetical protein